jgi:hypothetical protein
MNASCWAISLILSAIIGVSISQLSTCRFHDIMHRKMIADVLTSGHQIFEVGSEGT